MRESECGGPSPRFAPHTLTPPPGRRRLRGCEEQCDRERAVGQHSASWQRPSDRFGSTIGAGFPKMSNATLESLLGESTRFSCEYADRLSSHLPMALVALSRL